jgi:hypothetical protein
MYRTQVLALLTLLSCAHRPTEEIPLVAIPQVTSGARVRLVVKDSRFQDVFRANRPELLTSTDPRALLANRLEHELANNGVGLSDSASTVVQVELLDFWWEFRRVDFMDYRTTTTVRLLISLGAPPESARSWIVTGRGQQAERVAEPIPVAVDLLEIALDRSLREAHERGVFSLIASAAATTN